MRDISPEAYFDALVLMNDAPRSIKKMSVIELHLLSYLGCVLALFQGKAIGDWGYSYAITNEGFPFSAEFEDARKLLQGKGLLELKCEGTLEVNQKTADELAIIMRTGDWKKRRDWMRSATECALALPLGLIRYAIGRTPGMVVPTQLRQGGKLLDSDDIAALYDEYTVISSILGADAQDLLSPAVTWLSARILHNEGEEVAV